MSATADLLSWIKVIGGGALVQSGRDFAVVLWVETLGGDANLTCRNFVRAVVAETRLREAMGCAASALRVVTGWCNPRLPGKQYTGLERK